MRPNTKSAPEIMSGLKTIAALVCISGESDSIVIRDERKLKLVVVAVSAIATALMGSLVIIFCTGTSNAEMSLKQVTSSNTAFSYDRALESLERVGVGYNDELGLQISNTKELKSLRIYYKSMSRRYWLLWQDPASELGPDPSRPKLLVMPKPTQEHIDPLCPFRFR